MAIGAMIGMNRPNNITNAAGDVPGSLRRLQRGASSAAKPTVSPSPSKPEPLFAEAEVNS